MKMKSLGDLLAEELRDLYSAENQILKVLPKMAKTATNPELQQGFLRPRRRAPGFCSWAFSRVASARLTRCGVRSPRSTP
jgi:Domain of unknown function (DUF892)